MPATIANARKPGPASQRLQQVRVAGGGPSDGLVIGLVNNMPDAAIKATERQFLSLLDAASGSTPVSLRLFALPGVPRSDSARADLMPAYLSTEALTPGAVDALIITGAEPRTAAIEDEPYWRNFTALTDWASAHTISSIFSCLAAHAAVLHLDGIARRPLGAKLSGLYDCARRTPHPLVANAPAAYRVPHSRLNELDPNDLTSNGYQVVVGSDRAGADTFVREQNSLFVFFQGHMEYDAQSLLHEYHRDISRYIKRERDTYPGLPENYFDAASEATFATLREQALARTSPDILLRLAAAAVAGARVTNTWRTPAIAIYANWLAHITHIKKGRVAASVRSAEPNSTLLSTTEPSHDIA